MKTLPSHTMLYVDDSLKDHVLLREAARLAESKTLFVHLSTIDSARAYFKGEAPFSPRKLYPLPAAVLLDWNLPPHTGADLLTWLHAQPAFTSLPVVIYSSSDEPGLSTLCYQAGATHFLAKPTHLFEIVAVIHSLEKLARGNPRALALLPGYQPKSIASPPRVPAFQSARITDPAKNLLFNP
jgi:DNA-binding response OmpR family regulator